MLKPALRRREQRFRALFENAADGIFITNSEGRFLEVNARGPEMSGYSSEEFPGMRIGDLVIPQDPGRLPAIAARLKSGQPEIIESSL